MIRARCRSKFGGVTISREQIKTMRVKRDGGMLLIRIRVDLYFLNVGYAKEKPRQLNHQEPISTRG